MSDNLKTKAWAARVKGKILELYEIDADGDLVPPTLDVTDGLKIEYTTGDKVFVDSSGFDDNTSPSPSSYLNCRDSEAQAVISFVRARLAEESFDNQVEPKFRKSYQQASISLKEFWDKDFMEKLTEASDAISPPPKVAVPQYPFAIT